MRRWTSSILLLALATASGCAKPSSVPECPRPLTHWDGQEPSNLYRVGVWETFPNVMRSADGHLFCDPTSTEKAARCMVYQRLMMLERYCYSVNSSR